MLQVKCKEILTKMQMQGNTNEIEKANANASVNAINESIFIFYYMRLRLLITRVKLNFPCVLDLIYSFVFSNF